ncbi:MAG: cell division protein ZapA [Ruminococcaceae bacterium]|nr:cell division protein ZapA [Oscillospiraceae bacterium]
MAANKVRMTIMGADYSVIAEDDAQYVQLLGKELDSKMDGIIKANKRLSVTQAAVLAALDYADESKKATATADRLREQIKDYLDDASAAKSKADISRHEAEKYRKEVENLRTENERLKRELSAVLDRIGS